MKLWTPLISFDTPGDLSVSYTYKLGNVERVGDNIRASFSIQCIPTFTTASGNLRVSGLLYKAMAGGSFGSLIHQGITKPNYGSINCRIQSGTDYIILTASNQGQSIINITAANITSGGTLILWGVVSFGMKLLNSSVPVVAFIGDSITANWPLSNYLANTINAGVSGNTTAQMLARFQADVLDHSAATVVILGGNNDLGSTNPPISNITSMAAAAVAAGVRPIICTMTPVDWENTNAPTQAGVDEMRGRHMAFNYDLKVMAAANHYALCDYYSAMINTDGTQNKALFGGDTTHPIIDGYDVMWSVLEGLL